MSASPDRPSCWLIGETALLDACAQRLQARGFAIAGVASPDPTVVERMRAAGLRAESTASGVAAHLAEGPFDYLFSVANFTLLRSDVLAMPRRLAINYHDGPLPERAGLDVTSWSILEGASSHGISWHVMTEEADAGDLLETEPVTMDAGETAYSLNVKCFQAALTAFERLLDGLVSGGTHRQAQDMRHRRLFVRRDRPAGVLDWRAPAEALERLVRSCDYGPHDNPFGSAKLRLGPAPYVVTTLDVLDGVSEAVPGTVVAADDAGLVVATGSADVRVGGLHHLDGRPVSLADVAPPIGAVLPSSSDGLLAPMGPAASHRDARWAKRFANVRHPVLPYRLARPRSGATEVIRHVFGSDTGRGAAETIAAFLAFLGRFQQRPLFDVGLGGAVADPLLAPVVPTRVTLDPTEALEPLIDRLADTIRRAAGRKRPAADLGWRTIRLRGRPFRPAVGISLGGAPMAAPIACSVDGAGALVLDFDPVWFDAQAARDCVERFEVFRAHARPMAPLGEQPVLSPTEHGRIVETWNATATPLPAHGPANAIAERARRRPADVAVECDGVACSYAEFQQRVDDTARVLTARGLGPGDRVGVLLGRSVELVVVLVSCLRAGVAFVPLDPIYPLDRLRYMVEDSGLALIVADAAHADQAAEAGAPAVLTAPLVVSPAPREDEAVPAEPGLDALAYILYTSGSTGRPKGVGITQGNLLNLLRTMADRPGMTRDDRLLALTTVCFDILLLELFLPLTVGGVLDVASDGLLADPFALVEHIDRTRPSIVQGTPARWRALFAAGWGGADEMTALCGGEALPAELATRLVAHAGAVWNMFGPTETTIWSTIAPVIADGPVTIGRPIGNTQCYVLSPDGDVMPPGLSGELYIGGAGVAAGYHERPELTAQRFVGDPFGGPDDRLYRTGDRVMWDRDGVLVFLGRMDRQVKIRGYRVELGEIEAVARQAPGVAEAAVVAMPAVDGGHRLVGYVVGGTIAALRTHLERRLPDYMVPGVLLELDRLPLTGNGKVDRTVLAQPAFEQSAARPRRAVAPLTGQAGRIAACWRAVLRRDEIDPDATFFQVGGDSVSLIALVPALGAALGREVTLAEIFRHQTINRFAAHVAAGADPAADPAPTVRHGPSDRARARRARAGRRKRTPRRTRS